MRTEPSYLALSRNGELSRRVQEAYRRLADCTLCPHHCHVDRVHDEHGWCRAGKDPVIASWGPHFGEEEPLVGRHGSGTIFFSYCVMRCLFCQNYDISWDAGGDEYSPADLAGIMLDLQDQGCHNLNLVSPTHYIAPILAAVEIGAGRGLRLLPENEADTDKVMSFIAREISAGSFVNLMDQYYPAYRSFDLPPLDRRITPAEMNRARQAAAEAGLNRVIS